MNPEHKKLIQSPIQRMLGDDFNISLLTAILKKSIPWVIGFFVIAAVVTQLIIKYSFRQYEASTSMMYKVEDEFAVDVFGQPQKVDLNKQIPVVKAEQVLSSVAERLPLGISYFKNGKTKLLFSDLYKTAPFQIVPVSGHGNLMDQPIDIWLNEGGQISMQSALLGEQPYENIIPNELTDINGFQFKCSILDRAAMQGNKYFFTINSDEKIFEDLRSSLTVWVAANNILNISCKSINQNRAKDIANTIAVVFQAYNQDEQRLTTNKRLEYINNQIDTIGREMVQQEKLVSSLIKGPDVARPNAAESELVSELLEREALIEEIDDELKGLTWIRKEIATDKPISLAMINVLGQTNIDFSNYITGIENIKGERERLLEVFTPENNKVVKLDAQIEEMSSNLLAAVDTTISMVEAKKIELNTERKKIRYTLYNMPNKQVEFTEQSRKLDLLKQAYSKLIDERLQQQMFKAGIVSKLTVLTSATKADMVAPKAMMIRLVGIGAAFLVGIMFIVAQYFLQNKVLSLDELSRMTDVPIIGSVPHYKRAKKYATLATLDTPNSLITEAFRTIRTNLEFYGEPKKSESVSYLVTSSVPSEGKTFIALNLAAINSLTDKKVLLVDLDMRKPKMHKVFGLNNNVGMSNILSGRYQPEECVIESGYENLDVILSGPIPPNPSELIHSPRMGEVVEKLKESYDIIVFDTPPVGFVSDAVELLRVVDYPLYVVRQNFSRRVFINIPNTLYNEEKSTKMAIVLNDSNKAAAGYGTYGYGTYSSYVYYNDGSTNKKLSLLNWFKRK